jgi:hypothetical protein
MTVKNEYFLFSSWEVAFSSLEVAFSSSEVAISSMGSSF